MPFKHRVHRHLALLARDQRILRFVRPIQRERNRVRDEEGFEGDFGVQVYHLVAHARPRDIVDPGGVRRHVLRCERGDPFGESLVVFRRGTDLPAHGEEHDV